MRGSGVLRGYYKKKVTGNLSIELKSTPFLSPKPYLGHAYGAVSGCKDTVVPPSDDGVKELPLSTPLNSRLRLHHLLKKLFLLWPTGLPLPRSCKSAA